MFIVVSRDADRSVSVRLEQPEQLTPPQIRIDADVSDGESSFALFDSGAAVQQVDADYLISNDWLRRNADTDVGRAREWGTRFTDRVTGAPAEFRYVHSVDAVRASVVPAGQP